MPVQCFIFSLYMWGYIPYTTGWTVPMRQLHALYAELWNNRKLKLFQLVYSYVLMAYQWRPVASCTWGKKKSFVIAMGMSQQAPLPIFVPVQQVFHAEEDTLWQGVQPFHHHRSSQWTWPWNHGRRQIHTRCQEGEWFMIVLPTFSQWILGTCHCDNCWTQPIFEKMWEINSDSPAFGHGWLKSNLDGPSATLLWVGTRPAARNLKSCSNVTNRLTESWVFVVAPTPCMKALRAASLSRYKKRGPGNSFMPQSHC